MRTIVQIRGTNGSGKSIIPIQMKERDTDWYELNPEKGVYFTVCPNLGWVILGRYPTDCGGLDLVKYNKTIYKMLRYACTSKKFEKSVGGFKVEFNVLFEGIIPSTIFSTYLAWFKELSTLKTVQTVLILYMNPPIEVCLERIQKRNHGKPINEELVRGKHESIIRTYDKFVAEGITCIKVNTAKVPKEKMLDAFLKTVDKYDLPF